MVLRQPDTLVSGGARIFTTYRLQISQSVVVARIAELQLQQLQHFQLLQYLRGAQCRMDTE
jgi:hypothetical protein